MRLRAIFELVVGRVWLVLQEGRGLGGWFTFTGDFNVELEMLQKGDRKADLESYGRKILWMVRTYFGCSVAFTWLSCDSVLDKAYIWRWETRRSGNSWTTLFSEVLDFWCASS